jgi:tRNA 2-selenouridine synthase
MPADPLKIECGIPAAGKGWHLSAGTGKNRVMAITLTSLADLATHGFDDIIDVRAPAEYAEDHLPGAISLPVLDDEERAQVGTIYKQVSPFTARKVGAALVAKNAAAHLQGPLADKPGGWRPLVYCWRGGQRSGSFATILSQIGWRVETLVGGYKTWRGLVVQAVYDTPVAAPVVVLDGNTGSAKTEILNLLPGFRVQVIDLEGLANHRGSLFGNLGPQPSQKAFEGKLALALAQLDPSRPVVVEAESSKIGDCRIPPELWKAMVAAPRVTIAAARSARADYLARAYADLTADPARLTANVDLLKPLHPREVIEAWQAMGAAGQFQALADSLMERHYDPRYGKHRERMATPMAEIAADRLAPEDLPAIAERLARAIR